MPKCHFDLQAASGMNVAVHHLAARGCLSVAEDSHTAPSRRVEGEILTGHDLKVYRAGCQGSKPSGSNCMGAP